MGGKESHDNRVAERCAAIAAGTLFLSAFFRRRLGGFILLCVLQAGFPLSGLYLFLLSGSLCSPCI